MNLWQQIESDIQAYTGKAFELTDKKAVSGGDVNQAWHVRSNDAEYFVKLNAAHLVDMFAVKGLPWGRLYVSLAGKLVIPILPGRFYDLKQQKQGCRFLALNK